MRAKRYKSEELLRLYQAGQRNFRNVHIWNQSFKGQDLSGVDFEGAALQCSDFTNAILRGANFRSVICGVKWNTTLRKTSFRNADLTDADCTLARFERTDFNRTETCQDLRNCHKHGRCYAAPCTKKLDKTPENIRSFQLLN